MGLTEKDIRLIEQYCWDQLSEAERSQVLQRSADEPEFARELQLQQRLMAVVSQQQEQSLRTLMQEEETLYKKNPEKTFKPFSFGQKVRTLWPYAAAASIALMLALWWALRPPRPGINEQLFMAHYEPYRNLIQPVDRSSPPTDLMGQGLAAYEQQDFQQAVETFTQILENDLDSNKDLFFYRANAYLGLENTSPARQDLTPFLNDSLHRFHAPSLWYYALSFLQEGNLEEARKQLEIIAADPSHYKQEKATALLEELSPPS